MQLEAAAIAAKVDLDLLGIDVDVASQLMRLGVSMISWSLRATTSVSSGDPPG